MSEVILFNTKEELTNIVGNYAIVTVIVNLEQMSVTRINDDVYVFESKCPHFDHPMKDAKVSPAGKVTCTWHNYQFDLNSGKESETRCRSMKTKKAYYNENGQLLVQL